MTTIIKPFAKKERVRFSSDLPTLTKQSFKDECDINNILSRYRKSGIIEHRNRFEGRYGDFMSSGDYHTALDEIREAEAVFDALPSDLRERFKNDPSEFLSFVENPVNSDEMVALGLATKKSSQSPISEPKVEPVSKGEK